MNRNPISARKPMRLMSVLVLTAIAAAFAATPADAAKRSKRAVPESVLLPSRAEARVVVRRPRTRITVTRRSYLDAGTEVYPGSQNYTGYIFSPNYLSPSHFILGPGRPDGEPVPGTGLWNPAYHVPNWGY
jgi:hypothetical protein